MVADRTILASFYSAAAAQRVAVQLKRYGIEVAQVDELHAYPGNPRMRDSYLISGNIPSLSSITLDSMTEQDASVLLAADPAASGMSDDVDSSLGRNFLLTVICPLQDVDTVVQMIKNGNGYT